MGVMVDLCEGREGQWLSRVGVRWAMVDLCWERSVSVWKWWMRWRNGGYGGGRVGKTEAMVGRGETRVG